MSFDLWLFDVDGSEDVRALMDDVEDESGWDAPLTPKLAEVVSTLASSYPSLDDDPASSPWASWPLAGGSAVHGRGCGLNVNWSHAERMRADVERHAVVGGLTLYDPQSDVVVPPVTG
jgi:hypothetical protein